MTEVQAQADPSDPRRLVEAAGEQLWPPPTDCRAANGSPRRQPLGGRGQQAQSPSRRTRLHLGRARPCEGWRRPARPLVRQRLQPECSPRVQAPPPMKRRRISSATPSSPRAKERVRAMESRGRLSPGASASKSPSTRSAQSAAHAATIRRSASLSVCGELTLGVSQAADDRFHQCDRTSAHDSYGDVAGVRIPVSELGTGRVQPPRSKRLPAGLGTTAFALRPAPAGLSQRRPGDHARP